MAQQKLIEVIGADLLGTETIDVDDRTTSSATAQIQPGEPIKRSTATDQYALPVATGDPEVGTDIFLGVAHGQSTETSTVDGKLEYRLAIQGMKLRGFATTSSNINTAAKLAAIRHDFVAFDVTANSGTNGDFTIDEDEGDDSNVHALMIVDADIVRGTVDVRVAISTWAGAGV
jgi:hypothetical protein